MKSYRRQVVNRQAGLTLIELMIALAIGLILTLSGFSVYIQAASNRTTVDSHIELLESGYFVNHTLRQLYHQAGYLPLKSDELDAAGIPMRSSSDAFAAVDTIWRKGQFIRSIPNGIGFRFSGASSVGGGADGSMLNCLGEHIAQDEIGEIDLLVDNGILVCSSKSTNVEIIGRTEGIFIEKMTTRIGIDENGDRGVDRFVLADDAAITIDNAVAIRTNILLASAEKVGYTPSTYLFDGVEYTSTDSHIRRESIVTVEIRN